MELHSFKSLSLEAAKTIADIILDEAKARGYTMLVTVVDAAGHVLVFQRMVGAPYPAKEISEAKAFTAVSFKKATADWTARMADNPLLAQSLSQHPKIMFVAGGVPLKIDGAVVGAVGVSGGTQEQDAAVVEAALKSLNLEA